MKNQIVRYGLLAGVIPITYMILGSLLYPEKMCDPEKGMLYGYSSMLVGFVFIYVGVKKYRDAWGNREFKFGRALGIGLLMMAVACLLYAVVWSLYVFVFDPEWYTRFMDMQYKLLESTSGLSPEERAAKMEEVKTMGEVLSNPVYMFLITYTEPILPGIVVSFVSALILKRKGEELS